MRNRHAEANISAAAACPATVVKRGKHPGSKRLRSHPDAPMLIIEILGETLRATEVCIAPAVISSRLSTRGLTVSTEQVEAVFAQYEIDVKKNRCSRNRSAQGIERAAGGTGIQMSCTENRYYGDWGFCVRTTGPMPCLRRDVGCSKDHLPLCQDRGARTIHGARNRACLCSRLPSRIR